MFRFIELEVNNAVVFEKAGLPLANQGVVLVTGSNLDTFRSTKKHSSNAVGKSVLFELIRYIISDEPLRESSKDFVKMGKRGFKGKLTFEKDGKTYTIVKYRGHHKEKNAVYVYEGKKNITPKGGLPQVTKFLKQLIPLKGNDYYSYVHMSPVNFSPLINGKNAVRFSYLSDLLGLGFYDTVRASIKRRLDKVAAKRVNVEALRSEIKQIKEALDDTSSPRFAVESLSRRIDWVNGLEAYLTELVSRGSNYVNMVERALAICSSAGNKTHSPQKLQNRLDRVKAYLDKNLARYQDAMDYQSNRKLLAELKHQIKQLGPNAVFFAKNRNMYDIASASLRELPKDFYPHLLKRDEYEQFINETCTPENDKLLESEGDIREEIGNLRGRLQHIMSRMRKIKRLKGRAKCPTCNHQLDDTELKLIFNNYKSEYVALSEKLKELEATLRDIKRVKKHYKTADKLRKVLAVISKKRFPKALINILRDDTKKLPEIFDLVYKYHLTKDCLEDAKPASKKFVQSYKKAMQEEKRLQSALEKSTRFEYLTRSVREMGIKTTNVDELKVMKKTALKELRELQKKLAYVRKRRAALIERRGMMSKLLENQAVLKKRLRKLREQLKEALFIERRFRVLTDIYKAYGPKGLKYKHIRKLANILTRRLNYYASFLFSTKIQFSVSPKENAIEFMYEKQGGRKGDIRTMSSGEKRRLTLALIPSLMGIIPKNKRTNMLILDEVDSNVDAIGRALMDKFIPKLKKMFETIFVVSPAKKPFKNIDKHIQVVMYKGVSRLKTVKV